MVLNDGDGDGSHPGGLRSVQVAPPFPASAINADCVASSASWEFRSCRMAAE
jgi:hypothetical protein